MNWRRLATAGFKGDRRTARPKSLSSVTSIEWVLPALSLPVVLLSTGAKGNAAGVLLATIGEADGKVSSPEMGMPSFDPRSPSPSSAVLREASPPWEVVVVGVVTSTLSEAMLRGG